MLLMKYSPGTLFLASSLLQPLNPGKMFWTRNSDYVTWILGRKAWANFNKLQATLVRNYDWLTQRLTGVKCRATSVAKKWFYEDLAKREAKFCSAAAMLAGSLRNKKIVFVDELGYCFCLQLPTFDKHQCAMHIILLQIQFLWYLLLKRRKTNYVRKQLTSLWWHSARPGCSPAAKENNHILLKTMS